MAQDYTRSVRLIPPFGRAVAQAEAARLATLLRQAKAVGLTPAAPDART
jgi:hypothetical protein